MKSINLAHGAPLEIEQLDLSGIGLYLEKDPSISDDDYFDSDYTSFGQTLWRRKSDEGKKWYIFEEKELKLWSEIK